MNLYFEAGPDCAVQSVKCQVIRIIIAAENTGRNRVPVSYDASGDNARGWLFASGTADRHG
jgi:hypothetical protein